VAVEQFEHTMRLSPFDPTGYMCLENAACTYSLETRPCEAPEPWYHCGTFRLRQECADDETAGRRWIPKWAKGSPQSPATMAETTFEGISPSAVTTRLQAHRQYRPVVFRSSSAYGPRIDESVDRTNRIDVLDEVIEAFGQQRRLPTVRPLNKALHPCPLANRKEPHSRSSVFTQPGSNSVVSPNTDQCRLTS
jgi:hypothetical protein